MFKPVNDTYGHEMGDRVLHEFGKRMKNLPAEYDSFRTGGDEFLIIKRLSEHENDLTDVAKTIQKVFDTAIIYDTYIFNLSASLGISIYPDDSTDIRDVMQYADTAMYAVKHSENKDDYKFFSKDLIHLLSLQQSIRERLKEAVPKRDFTIYYQPQIDTTNGEIIGFEAFPHIKGDMEYLSPSEIIPVAEEVGIMSSLGLWLVTTALSQVKEWEKIGHKEYSLTVNLSPLQLIDNNYFEPLKDYMDKEDIEHSSLILDIANSVIMGSASSAKKCMKALHDEGFMLSLNDFGGDDINLSYVLECGFNGIKLSRSLIAELGTDTRSKILIDSIMALSENMKIDVTAVGVETKDQENALKDLGITKVQGYLYYKPVTADEIEKIISK